MCWRRIIKTKNEVWLTERIKELTFWVQALRWKGKFDAGKHPH